MDSISGSQSMGLAAIAPPGNLPEMHILSLHPRPNTPKNLQVGPT